MGRSAFLFLLSISLLANTSAMANETKESMFSMSNVADAPCPDVTGVYMCGPEGDQDEVTFKLYRDKAGRQLLEQRTKLGPKATIGDHLEQGLIEYILKFNGGFSANGKVKEYFVPFTSTSIVKYVMSCRGNKIFVHIASNKVYAAKLEIEQNPDQSLTTSGVVFSEDRVESEGPDHCVKK